MLVQFAIICYLHTISGRGTPNVLEAENNMTAPFSLRHLPTTEEAVKMYEERGGQLTYWTEFGNDPLSSSSRIHRKREKDFLSYFPDWSVIFHGIVNGDPRMFHDAIQLFKDLTCKSC